MGPTLRQCGALMYLVVMGLFDSAKRGIEREIDPLTPPEIKLLLDGRQQSDLAAKEFLFPVLLVYIVKVRFSSNGDCLYKRPKVFFS